MENKKNEANVNSKGKLEFLEKHGITRKSLYSFFSIAICVILVVVLSLTKATFNPEFYKDLNYWIDLGIQVALCIFGITTGIQVGDDINRNNPKGRFRLVLGNYVVIYTYIDSKKLFSFFDDWLEHYREVKQKKKIITCLKENGIHQLEVLDLNFEELDKLKQPYKKEWKNTSFFEKYLKKANQQSITYFMTYTEEQISVIKSCKAGQIKVSKLSSSFFMDSINKYQTDMWESAAHSHQKKSLYVSLNTIYRIVGLTAFSFIACGLEPLQGDSGPQVILSLATRLFCLATAIIWGIYTGMELVKIDISYLEYKTQMLTQYRDEMELGVFKPVSIEQKALEEYEKLEGEKQDERDEREETDRQEQIGVLE